MTDAPKKAKKRRRRKGAKAKAIPSREVSDGVDDTVGVESEEHHEPHHPPWWEAHERGRPKRWSYQRLPQDDLAVLNTWVEV